MIVKWWSYPEPSNQGLKWQIEPPGTMAGTTLAAIISPTGYYEAILWDISNRENYDYDILYALWECEAGNRHDDIWGAAGEYGGFQFMPRTFRDFSKYYDMEEANLFNFRDQAFLTVRMLEGEYGWNHWSCFRKLYPHLGQTNSL